MTVAEFVTWLQANTRPEDQIEWIDFHGLCLKPEDLAVTIEAQAVPRQVSIGD